MTIGTAATEIVGQRLAAHVDARAAAMDALERRDWPLRWWSAPFWIVLGAVQGWSIHTWLPAVAASVIAGAALFLALFAIGEVLRLQRRLDAVIVLVRTTTTGDTAS